jgi:hypothetical protein
MTAAHAIDWKNPIDVSQWRATRKKRVQEVWGEEFKPLLIGVALAADRKEIDPELKAEMAASFDQAQQEGETFSARAYRTGDKGTAESSVRAWSVPALLGKDSEGVLILSAIARRASPEKIDKAKAMFCMGLDHKSQRELACGVLGGEVKCRNGHSFLAGYECGNRYCKTCGPQRANEVFAKYIGRIRLKASKLLDCGRPICGECEWWRDNPTKTKNSDGTARDLPHWPPPMNGNRPRVVVAQIDFVIPNRRELVEADQVRRLNRWIKKFGRAIEREYGISRRDYGILFCDELGGNNTNIHAHGIYTGPFLPQKRKELSRLWARVTGIAGAQLMIKKAEKIEQALFHAIKYPAKFAAVADPFRLATLEKVFHRVRRVHGLAGFYNAPEPDDESTDQGENRKCPACGEKLSEPKFWTAITALQKMGLRDIGAIRREVGKNRVLLGVGHDPP